MPKFNLYQSLHTTVVGPQGKPLEVQIRTWEMHARAEQGVAAHWQYKDVNGAAASADVAWLNRIIDWQSETQDPDEFMNNLKIDLEQDEVFVFTPEGQGRHPRRRRHAHRLRLRDPHGGRPRLHRRPRERPTRAARLEALVGRHGGDLHVEGGGRRPVARLAADRRHPRAAAKIRQWFSRERREDAVETGREELVKSLRRRGSPCRSSRRAPSSPTPPRSSTTSTSMRCTPPSARATCRARRSRRASRRSSARSTRPTRRTRSCPPPSGSRGVPGAAKRPPAGVHVEGLDDLMVRLSRCCTPVPGDEILGFVTRAAACRCTAPTAPTRCRWRPARRTASSTSSGTRPTTARSSPPSR